MNKFKTGWKYDPCVNRVQITDLPVNTTKRAPCPRCGETEQITVLEPDPGEAADSFDQCDACGYIYEDCWQSYEWLQKENE